jgi:hypothetical protein
VDLNGHTLTNIATPSAGTDATNKNYVDGSIGGKTADLTGVGPATGDGDTLIWDQGANKWKVGSISDDTKLPLSGGTMSGPITMGGFDLYNTGHITMGAQHLLNLGTFNTTQEGALSLGTADKGKIIYNTDLGEVRVWNGSSFTGLTSATGDITDVIAGPGLLGGGTSGSVALSVDVGTSPSQIVQLDSNGFLPAVDGNLLTNINAIRLQSRSISSVLPNNNEVLTWNATTSVWEPRAASITGITALTGDVIAAGSGSVTATIAAAAVVNSKLADNSITSAKINSTDNFMNRLLITDAVSGTQVTYATCTLNQILRWNDSSGWECSNDIGSENSFVNSGNDFGTNATLGTTDSFDLGLITNNAVRMTVTKNGKIGIGTTNPSYNLDVIGDVNVSGSFKVNGTNISTGDGDFKKDGSVAMTGNIQLNGNYLSGDGGSEGVYVDSSGKVGIGTAAPTRNLTVQSSTNADVGIFGGSNGTSTLHFGDPADTDLTDGGIIYNNQFNSMSFKAGGNTYATMANGHMFFGGGDTPGNDAVAEFVGASSSNSAILIPRATEANRPASPVNGMIRYNTDTNKFEAFENLGWTDMIGGGSASAGGASGQVQFNNSGSFSGSSALIWDSTNNRLGIGTTLPSTSLQVAGTVYSTTGGFKFPDGSTQTTAASNGSANFQDFITSGTWTKPPSGSLAQIECWGAGGSGASGTGSSSGGGGGGGYAIKRIPLTALPSSVGVTIGAGGASSTTATGNDGGDSTFGTYLTAHGGSGASGTTGGAGGAGGSGNASSSFPADGTYNNVYSGGKGNSSGSTTNRNAIWGGGGGGSCNSNVPYPYGYSDNGGSGGNASCSSNNAYPGAVPGGGGGGAVAGNLSGAGANGECRITVW